MRRDGWRTLAFVAALGCAHAKTTNEPAKQDQASAGSKSEADHSGAMTEPMQKRGHPPVAAHADALLEPGAEEKIRKKLAAGGYLSKDADAPLAEGLRKFQSAHDMPATGIPDRETVQRLGLDPAKIFRDAGDAR